MAQRLETGQPEHLQGLTETVFQPGNLVHGFDRDLGDFVDILQHGLKTPYSTRRPSPGGTNDVVCMSLFSKFDLPGRFQDALAVTYWSGLMHNRPRIYMGDISIAFVISRERLLGAYPGQLTAVGENFWQSAINTGISRDMYDFDEEGKSVYGIPIIEKRGRAQNIDEVRLYPENPLTASITSDLWEALVIKREDLVRFQQCVQTAGVTLSVPMFFPDCQLIEL